MVTPTHIDIVDEYDHVIDTIPVTERTPEQITRIVYVLLYDSAGRLLLQKRATHDRSYPDHWDFSAGGRVEAGETYAHAAAREVREELGIVTPLYQLTSQLYRTKNGRRGWCTYFRGYYNGQFEINPNEVGEVQYFDPQELESLLRKNQEVHPELYHFFTKILAGRAAPNWPFQTRIIERIANEEGIEYDIEPNHGYAVRLRFASGQNRYLKAGSVDINPATASAIAQDKDYTDYFLRKMGHPTPETFLCLRDDFAFKIKSQATLDMGLRFAHEIGFPVIVKPNNGSLGRGVEKVHNEIEFMAAAKRIFAHSKHMLVQAFYQAQDYRILVLDDQVIAAYRRDPLSVTGDGTRTVMRLLEETLEEFAAQGRGKLNPFDPRIAHVLKRQGLTLDFVPERLKEVQLLDTANLSSGGTSTDVTDTLHINYQRHAIQAVSDMGLRLCGVDMLIARPHTEYDPDQYWILELNAKPMVKHYVSMGEEQLDRIYQMYRTIIRKLADES